LIVAENLHKAFGTKRAVAGASFVAHDGQITGLLGPNGAGKTTTLRMLYTLLRPDQGRVLIDGLDPDSQSIEVRRRLGALPDARGLYRRLTARENIGYFAALHGMDDATTERRTEALIETLSMQDIADRPTEGFSQGERLKTALARAMVHDPPNLLLDEPTNGLDVMSTRKLRDFLRGLKQQGRCVLFSTHVMQEVTALCDRVVVIANGAVVADGEPEALRAQAQAPNLEEAFMRIIGAAGAEGLA
jgi:sodium transport system ATP-binding protein